MSYLYSPALIRLPAVPCFTPPKGFWCGQGADAGYFAFDAGYDWGGHVIVAKEDVCPSLVVDGAELKPRYLSVNGYMLWSGGSGMAYYTHTHGWIFMTDAPFYGYEPLEVYDYTEGKWTGDRFWSFDRPPDGAGETVELLARGSVFEDGSPRSMTVRWRRWTSSREFGSYAPADGASGERILGLPRYRGAGEDFVRSYGKTNGHYSYGRIRHEGGKWVIGTPGADSGWWEGAEPSPSGAVTFVFRRNEGSEAEGADIAVSLKDHVKGDERYAAMLGEVAIWR